MIGWVKGVGRWYRGNREWQGEVLGGGQFSSETSGLVGLTPHVRYNFSPVRPGFPMPVRSLPDSIIINGAHTLRLISLD